jgi:hypothetical protein
MKHIKYWLLLYIKCIIWKTFRERKRERERESERASEREWEWVGERGRERDFCFSLPTTSLTCIS